MSDDQQGDSNGRERTSQEIAEEWSELNKAQADNEIARDSFLAVAHTALFAASVAFIGGLLKDFQLFYLPIIALAWLSSVVGLVCLTASFSAADKEINGRRALIEKRDPPAYKITGRLNGIALWSFPLSLVLTFVFVSANVLTMSDEKDPRRRLFDGEFGVRPAPRLPEKIDRGVVPPPRAPAPAPAVPVTKPSDSSPAVSPLKDADPC